jgi:alanyl-tRNA synthetase
MITVAEVREKYLKFFEARGHKIIPSASLIPENDPTTLFTGSGMQPLIPYLLGEAHPLGRRLANSQKCFRTEDIEEVGDNRHTTFFEMLGNWSLGDYWKEEQLRWIYEFFTREIGLNPQKLYVTVFAGDSEVGIPKDEEAAEIWKRIFKEEGIDWQGRIFYYGVNKNWWSRSGPPASMPTGEPGGPDSEIFYEFSKVKHDEKFGDKCYPNCDCGRFLEIGNSVFMEYKKTPAGFEKLARRNVDFGGGLERITAAANDEPDIFQTDVFREMASALPESVGGEAEVLRKKHIILDHLRASIFLVGDGVAPSNKERGYLLRRLIRRAAFHSFSLFGKEENAPWLWKVIRAVTEVYAEAYPDLESRAADIHSAILGEFSKFAATLEVGLKEFEKAARAGKISGKDIFKLFSTYGFPYELALEMAQEKRIPVDTEGFAAEMEKHRELSRTASAGMFKGGLADVSEKTVRLHTAHHLLLKALQIVLGPEVKQQGSNITSERLRLDFSYSGKMTPEQKAEVERIVNQKIAEDLPVIRSEMRREEAEKLGAEREFGQKYPERVSVYSIGPKDATPQNPRFSEAFSIEFCGGPHVARTGEIGKFRIIKEEAVSAGRRRIRGVVE